MTAPRPCRDRTTVGHGGQRHNWCHTILEPAGDHKCPHHDDPRARSGRHVRTARTRELDPHAGLAPSDWKRKYCAVDAPRLKVKVARRRARSAKATAGQGLRENGWVASPSSSCHLDCLMTEIDASVTVALADRYRVERQLGAGGMATVYLAEDLKHKRRVAVKVLRPELAAVVGAGRFLQEIATTASLQHPHILPLYDSGEADSFLYYVMPYVGGETLRERLDRETQLPIEEAVKIATEVADALDYAHRSGVIHRDIKPGNILLQDGRPLVADFGIALAVSAAAVGRMTETGLSLGTPHYMSPEQASGQKEIGPRSDVYSLGSVLFEMLAGVPPHQGGSALQVFSKIVTEEALPVTKSRKSVPGNVAAAVAKALEKLPADRFDSASAFRDALTDPHFTTGAHSYRGPLRQATRVWELDSRAWIGALVLVALAVGTLGGRLWSDRTEVSRSPVFEQRLTEMAGMEETPAISPTGEYVAFIASAEGRRQVFLRLVGGGAPDQITDAEADHSFPRWADNNTLIYFRHPEEEGDPGSLWETLILSSTPPRPLGPAEGEADVSHSAQRIATFRTDPGGPALILSERGVNGTETVIPLPGGEYGAPRWSPDDRYVAFQVRLSLNESAIQTIDVATGGDPETVLLAGQIRGIAWLPDGSGLVYSSSEGSTLAYPPVFSLRTVSTDGSLRDTPLPPGDAGYASYVEPDVTSAGGLVASRVRLESDVYRFPVDGSPLENVRDAMRVTRQTGQVQTPSASPDGEEVAYLSDSGGHANVWVARVDGTRPPRQITHERDPSTVIGITVWSPRGDLLVYYRQRIGGNSEEWLVRPDGTGERLLVEGTVGAASWSHDGEWVYYMSGGNLGAAESCTHKIAVDGGEPIPVRCGANGLLVSSDGTTAYFNPANARQGEVWSATPVDTGTPRPLVVDLQSRIPLWPHHYALSPDDRWLAAPLRDRGTTNLWLISTADGSLRPVTDFQGRSTTIGRAVSWTSDGKYLFAALLETDADIVLLNGVIR